MSRSAHNPSGDNKGRKSKLNPAMAMNVVNTLKGGAYIGTTCKYVGIAENTYHNWNLRGETAMERVRETGADPEEIVAGVAVEFDEDGKVHQKELAAMFRNKPRQFTAYEWPYVVFFTQTNKARAESELRALMAIQTAGKNGQWQAYAWFLERTMADKYGRTDRVKMEGNSKGDAIKVSMTTVDELETAIAEIASHDGEE